MGSSANLLCSHSRMNIQMCASSIWTCNRCKKRISISDSCVWTKRYVHVLYWGDIEDICLDIKFVRKCKVVLVWSLT